MTLSIFGHVIWHPKWDVDKKIGIAVSVVAAFSILVVVLTFGAIIIAETKQKMTLGLLKSNSDTYTRSSAASNVGKHSIFSENIYHITFGKRI